MLQRRTLLAGILLVVLVGGGAYWFAGVRPAPTPTTLDFVALPQGFEISVYADEFGGSPASYPGPNPGPRFMAFYNETLYVTVPNTGRVVALPDENRDGHPDAVVPVLTGLPRPHGIAFHNNQLYVANTGSVERYDMNGIRVKTGSRAVLVEDIPAGGTHWTRTIRIHNDSLFIAAGSDCNVCYPTSEWRTRITRCTLDGSNCSTYARGLRNTVGFIVVNETMIGTDNGRDLLGNDVPPDELNVIQQDGHYGYPECYGDNVLDTAFHPADHQHVRAHCTEPFERPAAVNLQAHVAPLGLAYYTHSAFPEQYRNQIYVALHGSWNRNPPVGYKIIRVPYNGSFGTPQDFATGWLQGTTVKGRPVDIAVGPDGALYVSDDNSGRIYRISYE